MIQISKDKPLLPETFVPWSDEISESTLFMPERLVSLEGTELWNTLTPKQQLELGRLEMVQVMYSYAWSETMACYFMLRHQLKLNPDSVEYRFLIREIIEEMRHQEMFGMAIQKLERQPIEPNLAHRWLGKITLRFFPDSYVFMSLLSVELMADIYAKHTRKDERVFSVLRKCSELHHIEEGRHIWYTEHWLKRFTNKAGFFKQTFFSLMVLSNIHFMRTLYVQKQFFINLGLPDAEKYYKTAQKNYKIKFAEFALEATVEFVKSFNGFNYLTKPLWRNILNVNV